MNRRLFLVALPALPAAAVAVVNAPRVRATVTPKLMAGMRCTQNDWAAWRREVEAAYNFSGDEQKSVIFVSSKTHDWLVKQGRA